MPKRCLISPRNGEQLRESVLHLFFCRLYNKKLYSRGPLRESRRLFRINSGWSTPQNFASRLCCLKKIHYTQHTWN